jgi:hypothetical protein
MPVTARLSLKFYERFGEEIANELVNWLNEVDATYRGDLKTLNELNFARFDAKLEQRFAEMETRVDKRFTEMEARVERRFAEYDVRLSEMESRWERRISDLRTEIHTGLREVKSDLIKWNFVFVAGGTAAVLSVLLTLLRS